jgi:uncharacterized phiE125 gp8 family phage protein
VNRNVVNILHPATSYIALSDVKDHLRIVNTDEDAYLAGILDAAFDICENYVGYPLRLSNVQYQVDEWPDMVDLHGKPQSFTSVKYYDITNTIQTLAASEYNTHLQRDRIRLWFIETPPTQYDDRLDPIQFNCQLGYLPGNLPGAIRAAILLNVGDLYEERKNTIVGTTESTMTRGSEFLLNPYRIIEFV